VIADLQLWTTLCPSRHGAFFRCCE